MSYFDYFYFGFFVALGIFIYSFRKHGFKKISLRFLCIAILMFCVVTATWPGWVAIYTWNLILVAKNKWIKDVS